MSNNIDSLEIQRTSGAVGEVREIIIQYKMLFRDSPKAVALSPKRYLELAIYLAEHCKAIDSFSSSSEFSVDGIPIVCKLNGPPEVIANPDHVSHIAYMLQKNDKRLLPLLMGA